jgi:CubicO group peptidase (beta-lactamase class C family)
VSTAEGFDATGLGRVSTVFAERSRAGRWPGAVLHVERRGTVALHRAVGVQDPASGAPMQTDSIFRIYSMTKPLVSVALLMLVERGLVSLRDPVAKFLPAFGRVQVGRMREGALTLSPPAQAPTLHDLLRHTAGLTYEFHAPSPVRQGYLDARVGNRSRTNAEHCTLLADLPLMHEPGTVWDYSRATDVVGGVVEAVSGVTLGEHLRTAIFTPLGMVDTAFSVAAADRSRVAEPHAADPDSGMPARLFDAHIPAAHESGGGGLWSTVSDYARFLRVLLGNGSRPGLRLLGSRTVAQMTADHLGDLPRDGTVLLAGNGFGLGVAVRTAPGMATEPGSVGSYGWSGAGGTAFFVDPTEQLIGVVMTQAPGQLDEVRELFRQLVYAALDD